MLKVIIYMISEQSLIDMWTPFTNVQEDEYQQYEESLEDADNEDNSKQAENDKALRVGIKDWSVEFFHAYGLGKLSFFEVVNWLISYFREKNAGGQRASMPI